MTERSTRLQQALVDAFGTDRVAAAAAAVACNLLCAWLLFRVPAPEPDLPEPAAFQVVWI